MFFCRSDKLSSERVKQVMEHVWKFQEFCNSMTKMEIDSYEYAYLKALVLFSPGEYALLYQSRFFFIRFTSDYEAMRWFLPSRNVTVCVCDSSDHPGVDGSGQIEKLQEKALMELQDYVQKSYPDDVYRWISLSHFCKLFDLLRLWHKTQSGRKLTELRLCLGRLTRILTRLPALRLMNSSITEELFFTGLIGNVSIDSIIPYILKMETAEYHSQDCEPTGWHPVAVASSRERQVRDWWVSPLRLVCWYCMVQIETPSLKQSSGIQDDHECLLVFFWWTQWCYEL